MKNSQPVKTMIAAWLIAMPILASNVYAQTVTVWNPAANPASTGLWSEAANWTMGVVPDSTFKAVFNVGGAIPCVIDIAATPTMVVIGDNGPGGSVIITNGGSLITQNPTEWFGVGYNNTAYLEVQSGGTLVCPDYFWVGLLAPAVGTFVMNGGTVTVGGQFGLGWNTGTGYAHINGGTLNLTLWHDTQSIKTGFMDIAGGTVIINGDRAASVSAYIAAGKITAYAGTGTVNVDYNTINPGKTTITASGGGGGTAAHINDISVSGGNVTVKYSTTSGATYHIETSSTLPASWSTVAGTTITGSGAEETAAFPVGGSTQFYRVSSP